PPPTATPFPYTTLFRSRGSGNERPDGGVPGARPRPAAGVRRFHRHPQQRVRRRHRRSGQRRRYPGMQPAAQRPLLPRGLRHPGADGRLPGEGRPARLNPGSGTTPPTTQAGLSGGRFSEAMSRLAGSSARAEYERLRQHRLTRLRHRWWAVLGGMLVAFFAGYVIVELVPAAAFRAFDSIAPGTADHAPEIPSYVTVGVGAVFAAAGAWSLTRPSAAERAWRKGAEGEETVRRRLESLRAEGVH